MSKSPPLTDIGKTGTPICIHACGHLTIKFGPNDAPLLNMCLNAQCLYPGRTGDRFVRFKDARLGPDPSAEEVHVDR